MVSQSQQLIEVLNFSRLPPIARQLIEVQQTEVLNLSRLPPLALVLNFSRLYIAQRVSARAYILGSYMS